MILIDALNVQSGGGGALLEYLIKVLNERNINYHLLYNSELLNSYFKPNESTLYPNRVNNPINRRRILKERIGAVQPSVIFCFGNFALTFKVNANVKVVTSFQNLHLLGNYDRANYNFIGLLKIRLRQLYFNYTLRACDYFIVPTEYIRQSFIDTTNVPAFKIKTIPFYYQSHIEKYRDQFELESEPIKNRFIYVSSSSPHKNHISLFMAWGLLIERGYNFDLMVTLGEKTEENKHLISKMDQINNEGGKIVNVSKDGFVNYENILRLTYNSEYTIFPSLNETFGFGLVEGALMKNKILVSDKDFMRLVVRPSATFDPLDPEDIAKTIISCVDNGCPPSELLFKDNVTELIDILTTE